MRARAGTRTVFQTLQTPGTPENMRNPSRSGMCMSQSDGKGVHIVHTPFCPLRLPQQGSWTAVRAGRDFARM
jgi:hypothetical protein